MISRSAFRMEKRSLVETAALCALQLVTLKAIQPLAGQRVGPAQQVSGLCWSENLNGHSHSIALETSHLLRLKIVSPLADTEWRAEGIAGQTSGSLAASGWERKNCERRDDGHSSDRSRSVWTSSHMIPLASSSRQPRRYKSHAVPPTGDSSRKGQGASPGRSSNAAAQRKLQETSVRREPWNEKAEKLCFQKKKSDYPGSDPIKELVRRENYDLRFTVAYAKNIGWDVIEMPRATVKQWIDATKATIGNPSSFKDGDAAFLAFKALCFTDVEPAVIITSATPLHRIPYGFASTFSQMACEIINVACECLLKGGALPEWISPRTVYVAARRRPRSYCFLPSEAPANANREAGISSSVRGITDVVDYLRKRIKDSDLLTRDFTRMEFTPENAKKFLMCRLKDAGLAWLADDIRPLMRRTGCLQNPPRSDKWVGKLGRARPELFRFTVAHNALVTVWQNVQSSGQDEDLNYAREMVEQLEKLVDVLREGTVASLFRAWELSQSLAIQDNARAFAMQLVRSASKKCGDS